METLDQHTIDAYVAIVLVSLPLPPLPVVVVKGEDGEEGTCSSHDLHAVMLRTQMHMAHTHAFSDAELLAHMETKTRVIEDLCRSLKSALQEQPERDERVVQKCYGHVCAAFRQYASAYPHTCRDLRILPLGDVVRGDPVHRQTCAYVSAVMEGAATYASEASNQELDYPSLLCRWLLHLDAHLE
jgi:hypothetical protein